MSESVEGVTWVLMPKPAGVILDLFTGRMATDMAGLMARTKRKKEGEMKKEKKEVKKAEYKKPVLTKHKKLRDVTAQGTPGNFLGCTKNF